MSELPMKVDEVLKVMAVGSTVSAGRVAAYAILRAGKVIGYVEANLKSWKLIWTASWYSNGAVIASKSATELPELMADFGDIDLLPTQAPDRDEFFRLNPPT